MVGEREEERAGAHTLLHARPPPGRVLAPPLPISLVLIIITESRAKKQVICSHWNTIVGRQCWRLALCEHSSV